MKQITVLERLYMLAKDWLPIVHNDKVCSFRNRRDETLKTETIKAITEQLKDAYNRYNNADSDKIIECIWEIKRLENVLDCECKKAKKINQQLDTAS